MRKHPALAGPPRTGFLAPREAAHARFRQNKFDPLRGLAVASNVGDDRANLLVAGEHQEGRSAAVRFHASEIKASSGCASSRAPCGRTVPQLCSLGSISGASAGGHSRAGSSASAKFPQKGKIGPETGRNDQLIRNDMAAAARSTAADAEPIITATRDASPEIRHRTSIYFCATSSRKPARRIGRAPTSCHLRRRQMPSPDCRRAPARNHFRRGLILRAGRDQSACRQRNGRRPAPRLFARHSGRSRAQHIRHRIGDPSMHAGLADGCKTVGAWRDWATTTSRMRR